MDDTTRTVVIFGGRSEIGVELATRLARGATVVDQKVDSVSGDVAAAKGSGDERPDAEHLSALVAFESIEVFCMAFGNHQSVSPTHRSGIEECESRLALVNENCRLGQCDDLAEDAGIGAHAYRM